MDNKVSSNSLVVVVAVTTRAVKLSLGAAFQGPSRLRLCSVTNY